MCIACHLHSLSPTYRANTAIAAAAAKIPVPATEEPVYAAKFALAVELDPLVPVVEAEAEAEARAEETA